MAASHDPSLARRAAIQALALCALAFAVVAWGLWRSRQPADVDEVTIAVGEVRSHSAEMAVLAADGGRKLPPRFSHAHAQQLGKAVERTRNEVASLNPAPGLAASVKALHPPLQEIEAELREVQRAGLPTLAASAAQAHQRTDHLERAEQALRR